MRIRRRVPKYKPSNTGGYSCEKCGSTVIHLSCSPIDMRGTMSCVVCGGTEDAAVGILKNGKRTTTYVNPFTGMAFDKKHHNERKEKDGYEHDSSIGQAKVSKRSGKLGEIHTK